jgi:putative flippase GtrA
MRSIDTSIPRFLVAGAANTGLTYLAYLLLLQVTVYRVAYSIAFVIGILASYLLNARFVFRRPASWRSFLQFPLIYAVQYLLGLLLVSLFIEWLGLTAWVAPLVALTLTIPLTYWLSRALFVGKESS